MDPASALPAGDCPRQAGLSFALSPLYRLSVVEADIPLGDRSADQVEALPTPQLGTVCGLPGPQDGGPLDPRRFGLFKAGYTINEAAATLSLGRSSLYRAMQTGQLRRSKVGSKVLLLAADLVAYLSNLREAA